MKKTQTSKTQLLLLEDVTNLGRKGELATAKPGFIRNFLLPQKKAVIADKRTIRMQEQLKEERIKQAAIDKKESEAFAVRLKDKVLSVTLKNDIQGHLYGSIAPIDIVKIVEEQEGLTIERKNVILPKPIKTIGVHEIHLKLKEDVLASFKLKIVGETKVTAAQPRVKVVEEGEEVPSEEVELKASEGATDDLPMRSEREKEMKEELEERTKE